MTDASIEDEYNHILINYDGCMDHGIRNRRVIEGIKRKKKR